MFTEIRKVKPLTSKRIGVFGKGGAGKTTLTVLLAKSLQRRGYQVVLVDADSTNLGLYSALGIDQAPEPLMDFFGGMVFQGGKVTCPVDDPTPLDGAVIDISTLSSRFIGNDQEGIHLLTLGKIGDKGPGAGCDGPISKIARDIIIIGENDLVTLIDFKAGFEDSARGVITSLDWALVVIDPTVAAIEMASSLRDMVRQIQEKKLPATSHLDSPKLVEWAINVFQNATIKGVLFVINRVPNKNIEVQLREKLARKNIQPIGIINEYPEISLAWLEGTGFGKGEYDQEVERIANELEVVETQTGEL